MHFKNTQEISLKTGSEVKYCVGLSGGDRTPDPQLRRLMLYPTELRTDIKKAHNVSFFIDFGRSTRIRTLDPLVPNQVRYQTAPHSDKLIIIVRKS